MTESNTLTPTDEAIIAWAMSHQTDAIKVLRGTGFVRVARAVLAKWGAPALASQPAAVPAAMPDGIVYTSAAQDVLEKWFEEIGLDMDVNDAKSLFDKMTAASRGQAPAGADLAAPAPQPVGEGEQSLRNAFGVWAETQGNGEISLLDVLSPDEAEAAFDKWKLNLVTLPAAQAQEDTRQPLTDDEAFKAYTAATGQKLLKQGPDRQRFLQAFRLAENAHGITDQQGETA